jgi:predicted nucleotidyltransferase component of viral defense system
MKREVKNLPASIHARLINLAREQGRPFDEVLQYYAIERFLYRLAESPHSPRFLLKGALLFYSLNPVLSRPTRDIDLEGLTTNNVEALAQIVSEICQQTVEPDGMEYDAGTVSGESTQGEAEYRGVRLRFLARLGTARVRMQLDVGFSDKVTPTPTQVEYPTLLNMPAPRLRAYTYETMIAEKLQAIVALGQINTRLKDFYDIQQLARHVEFSGPRLLQAIVATFEQRHTPIPNSMPPGLTEEFAREKQRQWTAFLKRINATDEGVRDFSQALGEIRKFVVPLFQAAAQGTAFDLTWLAGGPWG